MRLIKFRAKYKEPVGDVAWKYFEFPSEGEEWFGDLDPKTWCEWTGLKDKNGNEIFEADILKGEGSVPSFPVFWDEVACGFNIFKKVEGDWEVIGNIHENKNEG